MSNILVKCYCYAEDRSFEEINFGEISNENHLNKKC